MALKRVRLVQRRKIVGFGQEQLAAVLGVERSTVARWEYGVTEPQPWLRPKIAEALRMSAEEVDEMLAEVLLVPDQQTGTEEWPAAGVSPGLAGVDGPVGPEHDPVLCAPWSPRGTVEASVALSDGDLVERRAFLYLSGAALTAPAHQWLAHEPEPLASALSGGRVPAGLTARLPAMIAELRAMDDVAGGGRVLSLARHNFGWVAGLLDQASYDERTGRKLHVALAELGQLAGWAAFDAGRQALAQRYYIAALRAAGSADDRPLGAHVLGSMAYQSACQGRPVDAVTLIESALDGARGRLSAGTLSVLYDRQAYAWAILGDTSACTATISQARNHVERLEPDDEPPWLYWVSPAGTTTGAGRALLKLGQPDRATTLLEEGIALFDESFPRDRLNKLTRLAAARARPGRQRDLDAAAGHGIAALELAESVASARSTGHIRDLYRQLTPHASQPAVEEFLARAREFLAA